MEGVNFIDVEGEDTLNEIVKAGKVRDINFHLVRVTPQVVSVFEK